MAVMVEGGAVECWSIGGVEVIGLDELYGFEWYTMLVCVEVVKPGGGESLVSFCGAREWRFSM